MSDQRAPGATWLKLEDQTIYTRENGTIRHKESVYSRLYGEDDEDDDDGCCSSHCL